jgi:hypothetical protein
MLSYAIRAAFLRRAATTSFLLPHNANLFAISLVGWLFHFRLAAICIAVEETAAGFTPSARHSLLNVRERLGPFLRLSLLLFVLVLVAEAASMLSATGAFFALRQWHVHPSFSNCRNFTCADHVAASKKLQRSERQGVGEFVAEVLRTYHSQIWLFFKITAPAVIISTIAIITGRVEARELARHLPGGFELLAYRTEILEI